MIGSILGELYLLDVADRMMSELETDGFVL
jgi:hypothetical protein